MREHNILVMIKGICWIIRQVHFNIRRLQNAD